MPAAAVSPSVPGALAGVGRCRVLVVDDEPLTGSALARMLADDRDVVSTMSARRAPEALLRGQWYDGILCDVSMPEMSGGDLYAEIDRRRPAGPRRVSLM